MRERTRRVEAGRERLRSPAVVVPGERVEEIWGVQAFMTWYRRISDRRGRLRFELVGGLPAMLGPTGGLSLRDISPNGALVSSDVPLPVESVHSVRLACWELTAEVTVRVRHVTAVNGGDGRERYRIGLEFLDLSPHVREQMSRLAASRRRSASE